jgi:hypothetical protein
MSDVIAAPRITVAGLAFSTAALQAQLIDYCCRGESSGPSSSSSSSSNSSSSSSSYRLASSSSGTQGVGVSSSSDKVGVSSSSDRLESSSSSAPLVDLESILVRESGASTFGSVVSLTGEAPSFDYQLRLTGTTLTDFNVTIGSDEPNVTAPVSSATVKANTSFLIVPNVKTTRPQQYYATVIITATSTKNTKKTATLELV